MVKEKGDKTNLYLLSIVAIVAVVGVVVLVLNSGAGSSTSVEEATTFEVDGYVYEVQSSSDDLTGQVWRGRKCGTVRALHEDESTTRDCYRGSDGVCRC